MPPRERLLGLGTVRTRALRVTTIALLLVGPALAPVAVRAQDALTRADRARGEARHEDAEAAYMEALRSGTLDASEVSHAHLRLAELAYLEEDLPEGERHLRFALSLRADAPFDEGPPVMRDAGAAILVQRSQRTLRVVIEVGDAAAPIRIDVRDAPEGLVRVIEVRGAASFSRTLAWDGGALSLDPPAEARPVALRALDAYGNLLARAGVEPVEVAGPEVETVRSAPIEEPEQTERESLLESPWLWVVVGLLLAGVGVAVGVSASGERYLVGAPRVP